jgi:hypothetical protein
MRLCYRDRITQPLDEYVKYNRYLLINLSVFRGNESSNCKRSVLSHSLCTAQYGAKVGGIELCHSVIGQLGDVAVRSSARHRAAVLLHVADGDTLGDAALYVLSTVRA